MNKKTVQIIRHNTTGIEYAVVAGRIKNAQDALQQEMYFGWVNIAPITELSNVSTLTWCYELENDYTLLDTTMEITIAPKELLSIPEEKIARAQEQALDMAVTIGTSVWDLTQDELTGGNDNDKN